MQGSQESWIRVFVSLFESSKTHMNKRRIVITGMGIISCLGHDAETFHQNLMAGKSGVQTIKNLDISDLVTQFAGQILDFDPSCYMPLKEARKFARFIHFAMAAAQKVLEDAGLTGDVLKRIDPSRIGAVVGSGMGGLDVFEENTLRMEKFGPRKVSPFFIPMTITNMGVGQIAIRFGLMGPNFSISTACASANHSIIEAARILQSGGADIMMAGGAEAPITRLAIAGFNACRAISTRNDDPEGASRPFDLNRDGFVMGEGAGIVILETLESAKKRGAVIHAEYLGGGISCDASHMTAPREDGMGVYYAIQSALEDAGIAAQEVDYVNTHGTATPLGDIAEIQAIRRSFGVHADALKLNATKSMIGHTLGAAGGVELIATIMTLKKQQIHPTINLTQPDPQCDLDCVPLKGIEYPVRTAISNSFGFGGHNSVVVVRRFEK